MAESVVSMDQALDAGLCPYGMTKLVATFGYGYAVPTALAILFLDDAYSRIIMDIAGLSKVADDTEYDPFENGGCENSNGYGEFNPEFCLDSGEYGISEHGNGFSYCHRKKWERFDVQAIKR